MTVLKVAGVSSSPVRLPEESTKRRLLRAIEQSRQHFTLRTALRVTGLTHGRYYAWSRDECGLTDSESCPKSATHQLTQAEVNVIRERVTSEDCRHVSTGTLARLAERLGKVFASPSTWDRLVKTHPWRRSRHRVHPAKPKVGIRAAKPNEIWHVDTRVIHLVTGGRANLHTVIDNYSRRILSWRVADSFQPAVTADLLSEAANGMGSAKPQVLVDGGIENYNSDVDEVVESGLLT